MSPARSQILRINSSGRNSRNQNRLSLAVVCAVALMLLVVGPLAEPARGADAAAQKPISIYVSPSGSNQNPGTASQPLRDLSRAQQVVESDNATTSRDITVYLEGGTYRLSKPLVFGPRDSGHAGFKVTWTAAPGATPVISGAIRIAGWRLADRTLNIWSAPVPGGLSTRQIYVNSVRAALASGPSPVALAKRADGYLASSKAMSRWRNPSEIDFVYSRQLGPWTEPICPVASIHGAAIRMAEPCWNNSNRRRKNYVGYGTLASPTYIENAYELLEQPGQFYLDNAAHRLYYIPRDGQDMSSADVEVPRLDTLLEGSGTARDPIHDITFSNVEFAFATWMQPNKPEGFSEIQAGYTITEKTGYDTQGLCHLAPHGTCPYGAWTKEPGNIQFSYDQNLTFLNDRFVHLGAAGLNLDNGSQHATVSGSVFTDISGNGIELGNVDKPQAAGAEQTLDNTISDNHLYGLPVEYHGGVGILVGYAARSTISHNQIDHLPYTAISMGWGGWLDKGLRPPVANYSHDNVVSDNLIYDYVQIVSDGGGVYTLGLTGTSMANGEKITGNVIHDQLNWSYGLHSDNGATYVTNAGNVLYNDDYDWAGNHSDYRSHPGSLHPGARDPQLIENNYWQQGDPNYHDKTVRDLGKHHHNRPGPSPGSDPGRCGPTTGVSIGALLASQRRGRAEPTGARRHAVCV